MTDINLSGRGIERLDFSHVAIAAATNRRSRPADGVFNERRTLDDRSSDEGLHLHAARDEDGEGRDDDEASEAALAAVAQVRSLDATNNRIATLRSLDIFSSLSTLRLSANSIDDDTVLRVGTAWPPAMTYLDLSYNSLSRLEFLERVPNAPLRALDVSCNAITTLGLATMSAEAMVHCQWPIVLEELRASANQLTELAGISLLLRLRLLDVSDNQIERVDDLFVDDGGIVIDEAQEPRGNPPNPALGQLRSLSVEGNPFTKSTMMARLEGRLLPLHCAKLLQRLPRLSTLDGQVQRLTMSPSRDSTGDTSRSGNEEDDDAAHLTTSEDDRKQHTVARDAHHYDPAEASGNSHRRQPPPRFANAEAERRRPAAAAADHSIAGTGGRSSSASSAAASGRLTRPAAHSATRHAGAPINYGGAVDTLVMPSRMANAVAKSVPLPPATLNESSANAGSETRAAWEQAQPIDAAIPVDPATAGAASEQSAAPAAAAPATPLEDVMNRIRRVSAAIAQSKANTARMRSMADALEREVASKRAAVAAMVKAVKGSKAAAERARGDHNHYETRVRKAAAELHHAVVADWWTGVGAKCVAEARAAAERERLQHGSSVVARVRETARRRGQRAVSESIARADRSFETTDRDDSVAPGTAPLSSRSRRTAGAEIERMLQPTKFEYSLTATRRLSTD